MIKLENDIYIKEYKNIVKAPITDNEEWTLKESD